MGENNSNTTNVKVKRKEATRKHLKSSNSNTTNVKVKRKCLHISNIFLLIQIQPMLRLNLRCTNT